MSIDSLRQRLEGKYVWGGILIILTLLLFAGQPVFATSGSIEGTVTDAKTGDGIENVDIRIENDEGVKTFENATDATGIYNIGVSPDNYDVTAIHDNYVNETKTGVEVTDAESVSIDFSLENIEGWISGTVTDAETGGGIENVDIRIENDEGVKTFENATDSQGKYTIDEVLPDTYTVEAENAGYEIVSREVSVGENENVTGIDFSLKELGSISGTVTDTGGSGIESVTVEVLGTSLSATTDTNGNYTIEDVAPDNYDVKASHGDYVNETKTGVEVTDGEDVTGIDFSLKELGSISGTVTDTGGSGIEGVTVEVLGTSLSATTDTNGNYTIEDVAPDNYDVKASHGDYVNETKTGVEVTDGEDVPDLDFSLKEKFDLKIEIEGAGSTDPAEGTHTYVESGNVDVEANPDSGYEFVEWSGDNESTEDRITITMDENKSITAHFAEEETYYGLTVDNEGGGTVEVDPDENKYVENTEVTLTAVPDNGWYFDNWTGTDENGKEITVNMNENKNITASFGQYEYSLDVSVEGEGTVEINPDNDKYDPGTEVHLKTDSEDDWYFIEWTGDYEGSEDEVTITMDENKEITTKFENADEFGLTIDVVKEDPPHVVKILVDGEEITELPHDNVFPENYLFDSGDNVNVELKAPPGRFTEWEGDVPENESKEEVITITMDRGKELTAVFGKLPSISENEVEKNGPPENISKMSSKNPGFVRFENLVVENVRISVEENINHNVSFGVKQLKGRPEWLPDPPGRSNKIFEFEVENLPENENYDAKITAKVSKNWIEKENIDKNSLKMVRFDEVMHEWDNLKTEIIKEDDEYVYLKSKSDSFSIFSITGEPAQSSLPWAWIGLVVAIIVVIVLVLSTDLVEIIQDSLSSESSDRGGGGLPKVGAGDFRYLFF